MQSDRDLLKQALHTLEGWANHGEWVWPESALEQAKRNTTEAITALRERLAQPPEDRTRAFLRRLLDPEDLGHAVSHEVRQKVRELL